MRWDDERYVRLYTRDTTTWKLLPWQARFVLMALLRKVDRAGLLDLDGDAIESIAAVTEIPEGVVREGWPHLLKRSVFAITADGRSIIMPNFLAAQECAQTDRARKQAQRERARARAVGPNDTADHGAHSPTSGASLGPDGGASTAAASRDVSEGNDSPPVTKRDSASRIVTDGHETGQKVTPSHAESLAVTPCLAVPSQEIVAAATEAGDDSAPKPKRRRADPPPFAYQEALAALAPPGSHFLVPADGELDGGVIVAVRKRVRQFPDLAVWKLVGAFVAAGGVEFPRELNASWVASSRFCDAVTAARAWGASRAAEQAKPDPAAYRPPRPVAGLASAGDAAGTWVDTLNLFGGSHG